MKQYSSTKPLKEKITEGTQQQLSKVLKKNIKRFQNDQLKKFKTEKLQASTKYPLKFGKQENLVYFSDYAMQ